MATRWRRSGNREVTESRSFDVQTYGDVAILSYNFVGAAKDKDTKIENIVATSSRVYVKQGREWMLVHTNFAPVD